MTKSDKNQRIKHKTSRTAEMTCVSRAASFYEKNPLLQSADYLAPKLLPKWVYFLIKNRFLRKILLRLFAPHGIYEYVISRTKFIDEIFKSASQKGIKQVLIFGAGFDTRGIRLIRPEDQIKVFELDVPKTQRAKISQYRKRNILVPDHLVFIPINFNEDSLENKLKLNGFDWNIPTLFLLEGVLMYLQPAAVDFTFSTIKKYAVNKSEIIFDYIHKSVLDGEYLYYGEENIVDTVKKAKEEWHFGIESRNINPFLENYGFKIITHLNSEDLEGRFLTTESGELIGKINATHCIVHASYMKH